MLHRKTHKANLSGRRFTARLNSDCPPCSGLRLTGCSTSCTRPSFLFHFLSNSNGGGICYNRNVNKAIVFERQKNRTISGRTSGKHVPWRYRVAEKMMRGDDRPEQGTAGINEKDAGRREEDVAAWTVVFFARSLEFHRNGIIVYKRISYRRKSGWTSTRRPCCSCRKCGKRWRSSVG